MKLFVEKRLRWGFSYIAKRYSKAKNKDMKNHDPRKPSKYIMYLDEFIWMGNEWVSSL